MARRGREGKAMKFTMIKVTSWHSLPYIYPYFLVSETKDERDTNLDGAMWLGSDGLCHPVDIC